MKIIRRVFVWAIIFFIITFLGIEFAVSTKGKQIAEQKFSKVLNYPVTIEEAHWIFPLGIVFKRVNIEGLLRIRQAKTFFNASSFQKDRVDIKHLRIYEGEAEGNFNGLKVMIRGLQGDVKNFVYPFEERKIQVNVKAQLEGEQLPFSESVVFAEGWMDLKSLDMDEAVVLKDTSGAEILAVNFKSKNNNMAVAGKVNMAELLAQGMSGQEKEDSIQNLLWGTLGSEGVNMMSQFSFQTKMNDFHLRNISFSGKLELKD